MNITSAQYTAPEGTALRNIKVTIDGVEMFVPLDPANRHYKEIQRLQQQVKTQLALEQEQ